MTTPSDTSIEDRLRDYGQLLDHHIDNAPAGHTDSIPPRQQRAWLAVAAACVIIALGGIAIGVAPNRSEVTTAGPVDSVAADLSTTSIPDRAPGAEPAPAVGIEPAPDPEGFAGVDSCVAWIEKTPIELAFPALFEPRTETEQTIVLPLPQSPAAVQVLLIGPGGSYRCQVSRDGATVTDLRVGQVDPNQPLGDSEILLVNMGWTSSSTGDAMTGPRTLQTVGRVGADVVTVWAVLDDGTTLPAIVTDNGWFSIDGHIPVDMLLFVETYHWRLSDGTVRSAPLATLREETAEQQCAAVPGCVEQRVAELQATAQSAGLDQQASALADGTITESELRQANQDVVDCLNEAGIQSSVKGDGTTYTIDIRPDDDPEQSRIGNATCNREHLELISELYFLREAEAQLNDSE
ncbi:MAG: hypothetical protein GY724_21790 [Actinomycetia bacterium]|nr:hypothetical protein [Actinomycetes bacterium]MCP5034468.1 hypothetical protein [Actinomycetes bacterium]